MWVISTFMEVAVDRVVVCNMNVEIHTRLGILVLGLYALKFNMYVLVLDK